MFCVFGTFHDRELRITDLRLVAKLLVDATVLRLVLVPSIMEVLGERTWWFPLLSSARLPLAGNVP